MSRKFLTALDLAKNELQNAVVHNLPGTTGPPTPVKGQLYFDSTGNVLYWWDGTVWQPAKSGAPAFGSVPAETTFGLARADGVATTVARSDHTHGSPTHVNADHAAVNLSALAPPTADVSWGGFKITSLGAPVAGTDATNKTYVDNSIAGLSWKDAVRCASTGTHGLTGLTAIDGVTPSAGNRVLLKNQTNVPENGIYIAASGVWARASDADLAAEMEQMTVFVMEGGQANTAWTCTAVEPILIGTSDLPFVQFGGGTAITAGTGLTQSANTLNVGAGLGITANADDVAVTWAGNGAANTSARSDHNHDTTYPPMARTISTTAPLTGGGDLSANRTLAITSFAGSAVGAVPVSVGGTVNFLRADGSWAAPALDTTAGDLRYTRKYSVDVGTGALTTITVTHNLNTLDAVPTVYRKGTPFDQVECDVEHTTVNTMTLRFAVAPASAEYRCVVVG